MLPAAGAASAASAARQRSALLGRSAPRRGRSGPLAGDPSAPRRTAARAARGCQSAAFYLAERRSCTTNSQAGRAQVVHSAQSGPAALRSRFKQRRLWGRAQAWGAHDVGTRRAPGAHLQMRWNSCAGIRTVAVYSVSGMPSCSLSMSISFSSKSLMRSWFSLSNMNVMVSPWSSACARARA